MSEPGEPIDLAEAPLAVRPCSIAAALEILGERWALLAVRELDSGVHTFARIAAYTGASRDILADRLRKLESAGIIERRLYREHPPRYEYHLTQAGRDLFPVMLALREWGDRWAVSAPSVEYRHECGHRLAVDRTCASCGGPVTPDRIYPVSPAAPSPGSAAPGSAAPGGGISPGEAD
jgi:DNA-binding HxlR family transcriptional regulator